jgi:hypothetical protein
MWYAMLLMLLCCCCCCCRYVVVVLYVVVVVMVWCFTAWICSQGLSWTESWVELQWSGWVCGVCVVMCFSVMFSMLSESCVYLYNPALANATYDAGTCDMWHVTSDMWNAPHGRHTYAYSALSIKQTHISNINMWTCASIWFIPSNSITSHHITSHHMTWHESHPLDSIPSRSIPCSCWISIC